MLRSVTVLRHPFMFRALFLFHIVYIAAGCECGYGAVRRCGGQSPAVKTPGVFVLQLSSAMI